MQSTFLLEEPLAKITPWQDFARAWLAIEEASPLPISRLLLDTAPTGSFGKTSPAFCPVTKDETLRDFWATSAGRKSQSQPKDGRTAESLQVSVTPTALPTACLTLNTCEWTGLDGLSLKDAGVCSLSDILVTGAVPQRYYLSQKACAGILNRAEKRGKDLPPTLRQALQQVAEVLNAPETQEGKTL